jgi:hypothetical protein
MAYPSLDVEVVTIYATGLMADQLVKAGFLAGRESHHVTVEALRFTVIQLQVQNIQSQVRP